MIISPSHDRLTIASPAKINLFLELLSRRDDGYHELETIMAKLSIFDYLVFEPSRNGLIRLRVRAAHYIDSATIPSDETNLVVKAFRIIGELAENSGGMEITLFKQIPVQAGLGGASGNAAAAIVAANRLWNLEWPRARLLEIGRQLGSDVAFFLEGNLARCTGRGEQVQNLNYRCRLHVVVVKPIQGTATPRIYARCTVPDRPIESDEILFGLQSGQCSRIGRALFNRLEKAASEDHVDIGRIRAEFSRTNCAGHQLTGSGSCYFGIYPNRSSMLAAAAKLTSRLPDMDVFVGQTLSPRSQFWRPDEVRS
jgi:4-diphosphocytidyl-2-C-methyl-D-erythritol kinase